MVRYLLRRLSQVWRNSNEIIIGLCFVKLLYSTTSLQRVRNFLRCFITLSNTWSLNCIILASLHAHHLHVRLLPTVIVWRFSLRLLIYWLSWSRTFCISRCYSSSYTASTSYIWRTECSKRLSNWLKFVRYSFGWYNELGHLQAWCDNFS